MTNNRKDVETLDDEALKNVDAAGSKASNLLAHELTHVKQQKESGKVSSTASGNPDGVKGVISGDASKGQI